MKNLICLVYFVLVAINVTLAEYNLIDSDPEIAEKFDDLERTVYKKLLLRMEAEQYLNEAENEHLMVRKSQRSPSLRLRFGRSIPEIPLHKSQSAKRLNYLNIQTPTNEPDN